MTAREYKFHCHRLMKEIWGADKESDCEAYVWLNRRFKRDIHFANIKDPALLKEIYDALYLYSFQVEAQ